MLCLSEFYLLNRSSAKQSANSSAELTCDRDKDTLIEYKVMVTELEYKLVDLEERRAGLETQVANVQYLPRLVQGRTRIEELKEELHREEEEYAADLKRESKNHREEIEIIEEDSKRQEILLVSEAQYVLTLQETMKANEERRKNSRTALETARDFVCGFSVIGCGGNELDSTCALEDSNLLTLDAVRDLFIQGVEEGLPDEKDAVSRLFETGSKLMTGGNMKMMFRFLKNIGWDRSPSFSGPKIKISRIRSTLSNQDRQSETYLQMNLRLQQTIFGDKNLPSINLQMKNEEVEEAKLRAEEQASDEKKPGAAPDSTKKRPLSELNPYRAGLVAQANKACEAMQSASKRRRTGKTEDTCIGYSSPEGKKTKIEYKYQTPKKEDLDTFSISSTLSGTGFSRGYPM